MRKLLTLAGVLALLLCGSVSQAQPSRALVLSFDGLDYRSVTQLVAAGTLPNLAKLNIVPLIAATCTTTKPGHAEVLTGQGAERTGVLSNDNFDSRIKASWTIFFKVRQARPAWYLSAIFSKNSHTGDLCENDGISLDCRKQPWYLLRKWARRGGMNAYYNPASGGLGRPLELDETNDHLREQMSALLAQSPPGYFVYCHWAYPDREGHRSGMGSAAWNQAVINLDTMLGEAVTLLAPDTVFLYSDHGFDDFGSLEHHNAPQAFLASNLGLEGKGIRWDVAPTILDALEIPTASFIPKMNGRSLLLP